MAYRRRSKPRRPARKARASRMPRSLPRRTLPNTFKYKRFCADSTLQNTEPGVIKWVDAATNWQVGGTVPDDNGLWQFGGAMRFQLDDVISHTDFTNLYDRYKITGVKITFIPLSNQGYVQQSSSGNTGSATIPTICYSIDYDDSVLPTTSLDILEKMDAKVKRLDKPFSVFIKSPKLTTVVESDVGTQVSASIGTKGYVNCANDKVNFRGLKFYIRDMQIPDPGLKLNSLVRMQAKYYLEFKDPQ